MPASRLLASVGLLLLASAIPVRAQKATGRIAKSDSLGLYSFEKLQSGLIKFMVRAPRFPTSSFMVALTPGEQLERDVELDSLAPRSEGAQLLLPEVEVRTSRRLAPATPTSSTAASPGAAST